MIHDRRLSMCEIAEESDEEGSFVIENRNSTRSKTTKPSKAIVERLKEEDENIPNENFEIQNTHV